MNLESRIMIKLCYCFQRDVWISTILEKRSLVKYSHAMKKEMNSRLFKIKSNKLFYVFVLQSHNSFNHRQFPTFIDRVTPFNRASANSREEALQSKHEQVLKIVRNSRESVSSGKRNETNRNVPGNGRSGGVSVRRFSESHELATTHAWVNF